MGTEMKTENCSLSLDFIFLAGMETENCNFKFGWWVKADFGIFNCEYNIWYLG